MAGIVPTGDNPEQQRVTVGRIVSVYGVKGWVKVLSYTEPGENIFGYCPWWLKTPGGFRSLEIDDYRWQGKGLIAHIAGVDDRDKARTYCQQDIVVDKAQFPELGDNDYYWHQLQGLTVVTVFHGKESDTRDSGAERVVLGKVTQLLETGANDVLVVAGDANSLDRRERLVPYVDQFVRKVDLDTREIEVDWDPDF